MTGLWICAATLAADAPLVLADPAHPEGATLRAAGLVLLVRSGDVLHPPGPLPDRLAPLPEDAPLLAVLGDAGLANGLAAGLAVPVVADAGALLPLLVAAARAGRRGAVALRALGQALTPLPDSALAAAVVEGARPRLIALGTDTPSLLLEVPPRGTVRLSLPGFTWPAMAGALCDLACRGGSAPGLTAALTVAGPDGPVAEGAPAGPDASGRIRLLLQPGSLAGGRLGLWLHQAGSVPVTVEIARVAMFGATAATAEAAPRGTRKVVLPTAPPLPGLRAPGLAIAVPAAGAAIAFRSSAPQPPLAVAAPPAPPAPRSTSGRGGTAFQDLKLHQHLVNGDGSYRHLDMTLTGLVAAAGLWRQVRTKLFERRGVLGLEFREMAGWPQMFDQWPGSARDDYGPFWRIETAATAATLAELATPHDRALVAALAEMLPALARRGAAAEGLPPPEEAAWVDRAGRLAAAITGAGSAPPG
jgi:hypothetical protein